MRKTILVIDDSPIIRLVVSTTLAGAGHTVLEAADGRLGLDELDGKAIDMVICDLNMPHMDGIAFVRAARARPAYHAMPVLILTTESSEVKMQEGREAGVNAWMLKPFSMSQLLHLVDMLCA